MTLILLPLFVLAVVCLVLSLVAHGASLLGLPQPLGRMTWGLHIGIFLVLPATLLASRQLNTEDRQKEFSWQVALRGCPRWMRWMTTAFFVYAVVNFLLFLTHIPPKAGPGAPTPTGVFRGFSGHWMALYSAAAGLFYSALTVGQVADVTRALGDRWAGQPDGEQAADYDDGARDR
jgi:hypothetical protein